jgi:hypothetical protein
MTWLERKHPVNNTGKEPLGGPVAKAYYERWFNRPAQLVDS